MRVTLPTFKQLGQATRASNTSTFKLPDKPLVRPTASGQATRASNTSSFNLPDKPLVDKPLVRVTTSGQTTRASNPFTFKLSEKPFVHVTLLPSSFRGRSLETVFLPSPRSRYKYQFGSRQQRQHRQGRHGRRLHGRQREGVRHPYRRPSCLRLRHGHHHRRLQKTSSGRTPRKAAVCAMRH